MNFLFRDGFASFLSEIINKSSENSYSEGTNLTLVTLAVIFSAILIFTFLKLFKRNVNFKHYNPDEYDEKFKKFSGLILFLIPLLSYDLLRNLSQFYSYGFLFGDKAHFFLTEIKISFLRNWWEIIIYFVIFTGLYKVIFSFFNLFYLLNKKRLFKFVFLFYILTCVLIDGLKYSLITQVVEPKHYIIYTVFNQWAESIYLTIVLFLYVQFSRRINAALSK